MLTCTAYFESFAYLFIYGKARIYILLFNSRLKLPLLKQKQYAHLVNNIKNSFSLCFTTSLFKYAFIYENN